MSCFKIPHIKIHAPVWLHKGVRSVSHKLSKLMHSLNKVKPSVTPLKRMSSINMATPDLQPTGRMTKEDTAGRNYVSQAPYSVMENIVSPSTPETISDNLKTEDKSSPLFNQNSASLAEESEETTEAAPTCIADDSQSSPSLFGEAAGASKMNILKSYQNMMEMAIFQSNQLPDNNTVMAIYDAEDVVFTDVQQAYNKKHSLNIVYTKNPYDISKLATDKNWSGRQQFIYTDGRHSINVDLYKDYYDKISVITINSLSGATGHGSEKRLAAHFSKRHIDEGSLTISSFKTDVQKSTLGCKYFSMHFAKTAANDNTIIELHKKNIAETTQKIKEAVAQEKLGEWVGTRPHPHIIYDVTQSPTLLNARYYKHSHSARRLDALPENRKTEKIFKGKNIIDRANEYRVEKTKKLLVEDKNTQELKQTGIKNLTFSNSIDHYRRKRINEAVESAI